MESRWWEFLRKAGIGAGWDLNAVTGIGISIGGVFVMINGRWYGVFLLLAGILVGASAVAQFRARKR